ncbi:bifunctional transcriptional activator/DNA repair enzyme AdaA [Alkalihalobacillus sp. TS-13]|uniref:bifunctional transcriptional activator/DNA repair enzyme AdaA n=1 Tax=Alkalihalobacillus sp. TS-13 TaxID=2842455 RepID=UPI001C886BB7|nr:Ada metal-binding domain-containing protein [Alkalihalobacillus sp. TS-13]
MLEATIVCDANYDGTFFYAVKTTGIFCRPSCKSKAPKFENIVFFESANDALSSGFRPCKRCRPNLQTEDYDSQKEIVEIAVNIIHQYYDEKLHLKDLAYKVGVSPFYLNRIFRTKTGITPHMYIEKMRIHKSMTLLSTTSLTSIEIAYMVGYETLSSFYKAFKRVTNSSPKEYRLNNRK